MIKNRSPKTTEQETGIPHNLSEIVRYRGSPPSPSFDEFLTIHEAADLLKVKTATLYVWCRRRSVPHRYHGSKLIFSRTELCSWSASHAVPTNDVA